MIDRNKAGGQNVLLPAPGADVCLILGGSLFAGS
jgi:hypothetical protein